jgi:hypothetical protein
MTASGVAAVDRNRPLMAVMLLLLALICVGALLAVATDSVEWFRRVVPWRPARVAIGLTACVLVAREVLRALGELVSADPAVVIGSGGLKVRTGWRSVEVPYDDVSSIAWRPSGTWSGVLTLDRVQQKPIKVAALPNRSETSEFVRLCVEQWNEHRRSRGSG